MASHLINAEHAMFSSQSIQYLSTSAGTQRQKKRWSNQLLNLNITDKITTKDIQKRQENLENQHDPPLSRECQSSGGGSSHHNPGGMDVS